MIEKLLGKKRLSKLVFGDEKETRSVLVDAVDKIWLDRRTIGSRFPLKIVKKTIEECTRIIATPWMNNKTRLFVNDKEVIVLIYNGKWDRLWN